MNTKGNSSTAHMLVLPELRDIPYFRLANENNAADEKKEKPADRRSRLKTWDQRCRGNCRPSAADWKPDCMPHQLRQQEGET